MVQAADVESPSAKRLKLIQAHVPKPISENSVTLSTTAVRAHLSFLEEVHNLRGSSHLVGQQAVETIRRYKQLWLPLVAEIGGTRLTPTLVPPVDIAWVWHCHRLAPLQYAAYCREAFTKVLDPHTSAFRLQCERAGGGEDARSDAVATRLAWQRKYPEESFFPRPGDSEPEEAEIVEADISTGLKCNIVAASRLQRKFLWQVSGQQYKEDQFLKEAITRYERFLHLSDHTRVVPVYDIDLCWHTHMLWSTEGYMTETAKFSGHPLGHDDYRDEVEEPNMGPAWRKTQQMWSECFPKEDIPLRKVGATYRGDPPTWWFEGPHRQVLVLDDFIDADLCSMLVKEFQRRNCSHEVLRKCPKGITLSLDIPSDLHQRLEAVLMTGDRRKSEANGLANNESYEQVTAVSGRMCLLPQSEHRDHIPQKDGPWLAHTGFVMLLYLAGSGSLFLRSDIAGGDEQMIEIKPRRLVMWPNDCFTHRVADIPGVVRWMIGPMTAGVSGTVEACGPCCSDCSGSSGSEDNENNETNETNEAGNETGEMPAAGTQLPIQVKTITGQVVKLQISPLDKVENVKLELVAKVNIPADQQRLVFQGDDMEIGQTVWSQGVRKDSTIFVIRYVNTFDISVKTLSGDKFQQRVKGSDTVKSFKVQMASHAQVGFPAKEQQVLLGSDIMADERSMDSYGVKSGSTLFVVRADVSAAPAAAAAPASAPDGAGAPASASSCCVAQ